MNTTDEIYKLLDKLESQGNPAYKECCRLIERLEEIKDKTRKKYFISELEHVPDIECPNGIQDIYNHLYKHGIVFASSKVKISKSPFIRHGMNLPYDFGEKKYHVNYSLGIFSSEIFLFSRAGFANFTE